MSIQWFPGHMAKARRQIQEKLKLVDVVIELLDARLPMSSRNPVIDEVVQDKPRVIVLNKSDLADPGITRAWVDRFQSEDRQAVPVDALNGKGISQLARLTQEAVQDKMDRRKKKGIAGRAVRTMILGIPNVGKSSLINRMAGRKVARTGDRPAVTRHQQWVKIGKQLELLDTPGILWPKFEDKMVGLRLAASGAIKDEIIDLEEVALYLAAYLKFHYADAVKQRFKIDEIPDSPVELLELIGTKRGCLRSGGVIDYEKTAEILLREFRSGKIGAISLERPDDPFHYEDFAPETPEPPR
ncbi:MAG: ribosome biogenesis GTPase YlqF [Bacillaceae bacterium]|nr:ribosome biogenesis GTPase YlqF [Bacillaceae bacterium]